MEIGFILREDETYQTTPIVIAEALVRNPLLQSADKIEELGRYLLTYADYAKYRGYEKNNSCSD